MRIISANLNGIRSAATKGFFDWLPSLGADVVCVQELKAQAADLKPEFIQCDGLTGAFHYAEKKGYSGVGVYTRTPPQRIIEGLGVPEFDAEGRYIEADYGNLAVISLYQPSGSSSEDRQLAKYRFLDAFFPRLEALIKSGREIVICGDWNIAHREISLYPEHTGEAYTWWSNRGQAYAKNVGWRIDYQIATPGIAAKATSASVYKDQRFSDHAPLIVDYDLTL
ncbi:MAG: DNA-(apurinic or apyrimidinic site) lyase [Hydrogenophilales bacterium 16-64-40]|nr:MAG: DNA-(apurinic or apyrimidinic site) lyase [Hydrogenophilales bacterium 16-64-40]